MFKASKDLTMPTTIIGSLPRPHWYTVNIDDRPFRIAMSNAFFREQYLDAVSSYIRDQERAGLDIVTDGDARFGTDVGGASWMMYPARRLTGTAGLELVGKYTSDAEPGTILRECAEARPAPIVVGKIGRGTLEYTPIWRTAQSMTTKPVKLGTPAAEVVEGYLVNRYYKDRRELVLDIADAINEELTELARAGCPAIQIEAPWITRSAHRQRPDVWEPEFYVEVFHRTTRGLQDLTELWCHTCWGNPAQQRPFAETPTYRPVIDLLNELKCDVMTFENADSGCMDLDAIGQGITTKKVAIGVISHRTLQVERPEEVAEILRRALEYIPPERLIVTADCGFGREGMSRRIAFYKMVAMVRGTNIVRRELGLPEQPCRAADPQFTLSPD